MQSKYIRDLLAHSNTSNAKGVSPSMSIGCKLNRHGATPLSEPHKYHSMVGALQYVTLTRPYIAFSVNKAYQFMASPLKTLWSAFKHVSHYLNDIIHHGFMLSPTPSSCKLCLRAYSGSDWKSDLDDRHSTSGACIFVGSNLVSWSSKKQLLVARSSTKAE